MSRKYKRITYEDRKEIEKLINADTKKNVVCEQIGISRGTLFGELKRGTNPNTGEYEALRAQKNYCSAPK